MEKKIIFEGNNFIATQLIGEGGFGKVYLGETKDTNQICAIKKIKLSKNRKMTSRELKMMEEVKHENCVQLFFIEPKDYQNADSVYIIMEYCDMGNLNEYLKSKKDKNEKLFIEEAKEIFGQIVRGLKYLYEKGIVHRSLKPQDILLQSNNNSKFGYTIKLADFGFARKIQRDDSGKTIMMNSIVGTPLYIAPEILFNNSYTSNVDLWSLGAILYEIITGNPPFQAKSLGDLERQYNNTIKKSLPKEYIEIFGKECNDLIEKLLTVDPNSRITREELYKHPFISKKLNELKEKSIEIADLEKKIIGIAKEDFESKENGKFSFKKGDVIEIIKINKNKGICEGKLKEKEGIIELKRIDLYEEIEDIYSINELNNNNDNQLINFEKRIIGIVSNEYKTNEISLSKGDLIEINNINDNNYCIIQFGNQKYEIPFFFFDFYKQIGEKQKQKQKQNPKKIIGIAKEDFESKENGKFSFKKEEIIEIIEIYKNKGICEGKLKEKEGIIELKRIDLYEEIEYIYSINESNNNNDNQTNNLEKRTIGIVKFEYKTNEISLSKEDLVGIININEDDIYCMIQFRNQKYEIPFFFFDFYKKI
ncbi:serine/threonine-protein kinase ulk3 [Anaeramoeba ignava]|uniref:Serine/threonine-protein kinase ulk3 n=1 Tax=Anaeramoeba ignava TaxID=1746090 RepID=A0A9Q0LZ62_ANAIG|nr:serine/threonine-protein kinase ulk3 [Anaeramoeba ignava]